MRRALNILLSVMSLLTLAGCDVHEFPELPSSVEFNLRLNFESEITEWEHRYEDGVITEQGIGESYDNHLYDGEIRYIVRAYPASRRQRTTAEYTHEFVFSKDIADGYNHEALLELPAGNYTLMVWADLREEGDDEAFYDATDFNLIRLQGEHKGNTDYRDAFCGSCEVSLVADIREHEPEGVEITMQRPLAKYEFRTTDVLEFLDKERVRVASKMENEGALAGDTPTRVINLDDYRVVFYYVAFMPNAFNIFTNRPSDSATGVMFETTLKKLAESEAVMGFDYVFVNGNTSAVKVQIGVYDNEGTQLSLTEPMDVALKRGRHTILTGSFLMIEASGGVTINPDFDGDFNINI